jgi:YHS domain-containing protein
MNSKSTLAILIAAVLGGTLAFADTATVPKNYPLKKCVVSGDTLGKHGKAVKVSYHGTDVYLCCNDCVADFNKHPAKYVKMVKDAEAKK